QMHRSIQVTLKKDRDEITQSSSAAICVDPFVRIKIFLSQTIPGLSVHLWPHLIELAGYESRSTWMIGLKKLLQLTPQRLQLVLPYFVKIMLPPAYIQCDGEKKQEPGNHPQGPAGFPHSAQQKDSYWYTVPSHDRRKFHLIGSSCNGMIEIARNRTIKPLCAR